MENDEENIQRDNYDDPKL